MTAETSQDRIDDVALGDLVGVDRGAGSELYEVVHRDIADRDGRTVVLITFQTDSGETFDVAYESGTVVDRALEAKWESAQSGQRPGDASSS